MVRFSKCFIGGSLLYMLGLYISTVLQEVQPTAVVAPAFYLAVLVNGYLVWLALGRVP